MDAPKSDRSDSVSSTGSTTSPMSPTGSGRRASLFASLQEHKRPMDAASVARRKSLHEQRPPTGFIGTMWNK